MLKPALMFGLYLICTLLNLSGFIHASLDKRWVWAAIDWVFVSIILLFTLSYGYRLSVAWRWRHRHEP